jgi:hypothetical protein
VKPKYPKNGPLGARKAPVGKCISEDLLQFGEVVQLKGGLDPMRKYSGKYQEHSVVPAEAEGEMGPMPGY